MEDILVVVFDTAQRAYEGLNALNRLDSDGVSSFMYSMDAQMQELGGVVFRTEKRNFEHKLRVRQITLVRGQI
jgi:hypothetical protein